MTSLLLALLSANQPPQPANAIPHRVLYNVTADLATSAVISWRTEEPAVSQGQIAVASPDPRFPSSAQMVPAESAEFILPKRDKVYYHSVNFSNLNPDSLYNYRVGSEGGWSEWVQFRTAKKESAPFSFVYFGDAQNDVKSMWSRVIRQSYRETPKAAFLLHAGDLINNNAVDQEWADWFYAGGWIHNQTPVLATPGNHEYTMIDNKKALSPFWKPQFVQPENGITGLERSCFYIDYQGTRIISLNSNERIEEQTKWLDKTLAENPGKWSIVTFHHPVYSTAQGRDNPEVRKNWAPVIEKHKVALVLQGHDHAYGRTNVMAGANGISTSGTVYVVSVSGPKMYRLGAETAKIMPRRAEYSQLYQIIHVDQKKIRFESYLATGELYDAFEITKKADGSNVLKEIKTVSPERIEKDASKSGGG